MKKYTCLLCEKTFESNKKDKNRTPKYCSRECSYKRITKLETKDKQSQAKKGKVPWNKGVEMWKHKQHPRGTLGKLGLGKGRKASIESREKMRLAHLGKKLPNQSGSNHPMWKGGITDKNEKIRKSSDYRNWRNLIFQRDNYTCQLCGIRGNYIHVDHILPFSTNEDKRLDLQNGRTLCVDCHKKTDTYGGKMHRKRKSNV